MVVRVPQGIYVPPRTATLVVAANNSTDLGKAQADYVCDGVNDHVEIQAALDALPATGGRVVLLEGTFIIASSIAIPNDTATLEGQGKGTILDGNSLTTGNHVVTISGKDNITIRNLAIQTQNGGGKNCDCIYIVGVSDNITIDTVYILSSDRYGVYLYGSSGTISNLTIKNCEIQSCETYAIYANTFSAGKLLQFLLISNNTIKNNGSGIYINTTLVYSEAISILDNMFQNTANYGIMLVANHVLVEGNSSYQDRNPVYVEGRYNNIVSNYIYRAGRDGIYLNSTRNFVSNNTIIDAGYSSTNTYDGISINDSYNTVVNNFIQVLTGATALTRYGIYLASGSKSVIVGNRIHAEFDPDYGTAPFMNHSGYLNYIGDDNIGVTVNQIKHLRRVKNTSGGALAIGDVVILKAVAAGDEMTTTVTQGDDSVYGVVAEAIADTEYGLVQTKGFTADLKVNGTTDIAIGDTLCTFTTAKIACKAGAGDQVFARALEAYAGDDSNGVIDAYIKSPWD